MIIYKLTSPSGWVYVGQTSNFKKRMQGHKYDAANHRDSCILLCRAIRKYGWENFAISNLCTGVRCKSRGKSHVRKTVGGFIWKHKANVVPINVSYTASA